MVIRPTKAAKTTNIGGNWSTTTTYSKKQKLFVILVVQHLVHVVLFMWPPDP